MGSASMRKKFNKRSNTKPQEPISMASSPSLIHFKHKRHFLIISALLIVCLIVLLSISSNIRNAFGSSNASSSSNQVYTIEVVNEFPHDPSAFTQGLLYAGNDTLFESTGLYGRSSVRKVDLQTGKVNALHKMQGSDFGEGLTLLGERLFQVTWLQKIGFIYDRNNLSRVCASPCSFLIVSHIPLVTQSVACVKEIFLLSRFTHQMQDGWGLATDGKILFGCDGTSMLYQIDPQTLKVTRKQTVKYNGHEVPSLNELEYINGEVWANVWQTDCIARISPRNGIVLGWILLHKLREGLVAAGHTGFDVLNGIAWDENKNRLFVTGKLWPKLYEIKLQALKTPFNGDIEEMCIPMPVYFAKP